MATKPYQKALFVFRRDLRLDDNTALLEALTLSQKTLPIFIIDPRQVGSSNTYRSQNCMQFMEESLNDLASQLKKKKAKLYLFKGIAEKVIAKLVRQEKIEAVFLNKDYTPFSLTRDRAIEKLCAKHDIDYISCNDALLNNPETIHTKSGTPYAVFTPFMKACRRITVKKPQLCRKTNFYTGTVKGSDNTLLTTIFKKKNPELWVHGGTKEAKKLLANIKRLNAYKKTRDFPALMTSNLSAHNKFGTISIRELYHKISRTLSAASPLITQLYWRDFFYHVAYHSPFVFGQPYHEKYKNLWWSKSKKDFERWCSGTTGFPIVDAGMRQLNETGYMHNRTRMIVASFLTKDLHINWLWGERYFAQKLVDYDPCVNNGSWQWAASTGCDAQPYFRIFNPWLQQKKFDPECTYIKEWVPELKNIKPAIIHTWYRDTSPKIKDYPAPMVDHSIESARAKQLFKEV